MAVEKRPCSGACPGAMLYKRATGSSYWECQYCYRRQRETQAEELCRRLLNPEELGHAVTAEVRDLAREALGRPTVETVKNDYVSMKIRGGRAKFCGKYDDFICEWSSFNGYITELLESVEASDPDEPVTVEFANVRMTDAEFKRYCEINEVEFEE